MVSSCSILFTDFGTLFVFAVGPLLPLSVIFFDYNGNFNEKMAKINKMAKNHFSRFIQFPKGWFRSIKVVLEFLFWHLKCHFWYPQNSQKHPWIGWNRQTQCVLGKNNVSNFKIYLLVKQYYLFIYLMILLYIKHVAMSITLF